MLLQVGKQRLLQLGAPAASRACVSTSALLRKDASAKESSPQKTADWAKDVASHPEKILEAGQEIAESVGRGVMAAANLAAHKVGLKSDKVASSPARMGAAGKMEHAPPGSTTGGPQASAEHARAKFDEIAEAVKPDWEGDADVNRQFPEMAESARLQNLPGGQAQSRATEGVMADLGKGSRREGAATPAAELKESLHDMGP